jgi:hypothetical protein
VEDEVEEVARERLIELRRRRAAIGGDPGVALRGRLCVR